MDKPIRVMAFGTFDLLHEGHRAYLAQARALGMNCSYVLRLTRRLNG